MTLKGFKSFASSTTLNFEPGITCVVGPNGSGKSNVLDALSWVMGEQGAKSLRGGKMEDVIFAGTSGRAPLGRAEVSVTIDNADQSLPIEFTEVTISRVLFRNGASEYLLNGETTRLLDIQELLSDSGIGREMHVIVGQGQLDAILLANPEERRAFIEEAAGVLKHRKRKEKALRKLDSMQGNLARIQDLTVELRRNLKPLGKQAEVARKASTIQSDVRDSRLRLLADDLLKIQSSLDAEIADESMLRLRRDEVEAELQTVRLREAELDQISALENPLLVQAQENFYRLTAAREKFRGIQSLSSERARFLGEEAEDARASGRDPLAMDNEARALRSEENLLRSVLSESQSSLASVTAALRQSEAELIEEEKSVSESLRAIADQREGTARQEGNLSALRSRIDATNAEISRLIASRNDASERLKAFRGDFAALEGEISTLGSTEPDLDQSYENAKGILSALQEKFLLLQEEEQQAQRDRAGLTSRLHALEESLLHRDGGDAILSGRSGARVKGRLASLITITSGWEGAVAAALGPLADSIVVDDLGSALSAVGMLKAEAGGRSELLVIEGDQGLEAPAIPAGLTKISSLITSVEIDPLLALLLNRFVAVEDLAEAEAALKLDPALVAVTRDGDLVSRNRVRGGSVGSQSAIEITALLTRTEDQVAVITARCESLAFTLATLSRDVESARATHDRALAGLNDSDAKMSGLAEQMAVAGQNVKSAQAEVERLLKSEEEATQQRDQHEDELAIATQGLQPQQETVEPNLSLLEELRSQVSAARAIEVEARLELRTVEERLAAVAARAKSLEDQALNERENASKAITRREQRVIAAATAQIIADTAYETLIQIEVSISKALAERQRLELARTEREGEILAVRGRGRELTIEVEALTSSVHRDEIVRAEQRLRVEALERRAMDEHGVDGATLASEYGPANDVPTFVEDEDGNWIPGELIPFRRDQQEKRLLQAERAMAMLGKINPLALEEYDALEERLKYLAEQLEDLKKTKRDLLDIVKEVDDKVQEIFYQAFLDTEREFRGIFARLFPGGEGRLILTNPEDPINSGVDVEARPPGKRVKRLSLLSGGERSLVAVAMLVAIFKARPSPFYILDEVEAALDDVNLGRLLGVFEELRAQSQLIIITHQKRTMEIADSLYGVTMRGDGVSEVISQRLREIEPVS